MQEILRFLKDTVSVDKVDPLYQSDACKYVPAWSLKYAEAIQEVPLGFKVVHYKFPNLNIVPYVDRSYEMLLKYLLERTMPGIFKFKLASEDIEVVAFAGTLMEKNGRILMCLAIENNTLQDNTEANRLKKDSVILYISSYFASDPKYKNIFKRIEQLYIRFVRQLGLDIVYTQDINSRVSNTNIVIPTFSSIPEKIAYIRELGRESVKQMIQKYEWERGGQE